MNVVRWRSRDRQGRGSAAKKKDRTITKQSHRSERLAFESKAGKAVGCVPMNGCFVDRRIDSFVDRRIDTRSEIDRRVEQRSVWHVNEGDRMLTKDRKKSGLSLLAVKKRIRLSDRVKKRDLHERDFAREEDEDLVHK